MVTVWLAFTLAIAAEMSLRNYEPCPMSTDIG
jgi:hypothetical protein